MKTRLIPIGNSYGVRIPKSLIEHLELDRVALEILVRENGILITPVTNLPPLAHWDKLFKAAKKKGFDAKKDAEDFSDWTSTSNDGGK